MRQPARNNTTAAAVLLSLFLSMLLAAARAGAADDAGQVHVIVGNALRINAAGQEIPVQKGMTVAEGDRIVTAEQALVQIKLRDGTYLSVRSSTDMTISHFRWDEKPSENSGMLLQLAKGALRSITGAIARGRPSAYSVLTPTATIGIRGTDHEPVFIPEPKPGEIPIGTPGTYDKVNSGATFIHTAAGRVDVHPGQVGFVPAIPRVPPTILPKTPDFFKKLDVREDRRSGGDRETQKPGRPEAGEGRRGEAEGRRGEGEGRRGEGDNRPGEGRQGRPGQGQVTTGAMPQGVGSQQGGSQPGQAQPGAAAPGGTPSGPMQPGAAPMGGMPSGPMQPGATPMQSGTTPVGGMQSVPVQPGATAPGAMQAGPMQPAGIQPATTMPSAPTQQVQPMQQPIQPMQQPIQPMQPIAPMTPTSAPAPMQVPMPTGISPAPTSPSTTIMPAPSTTTTTLPAR